MKRYLLSLLLLTLLPFGQLVAQPQEEELLAPEEAFALTVSQLDETTLRAEWAIADGYYMYRSKFRFDPQTAGVTLGEARYPKGKLKQDEFFGEIEIYRGRVVIDIPLIGVSADNRVTLQTTSQGCADIGVCYPPFRQIQNVTLKASTTPQSAPALLSGISSLLGIGGGSGDEILPPDEAFRLSAIAVDGSTLLARWELAEGHYLYKNKFDFALKSSDGSTLGEVSLPPGKEKHDEFFGLLEVYYDLVEATLPLNRGSAGAASGELTVSYQGCSELTGICYPPQARTLTIDIPTSDAMRQPPTSTSTGAPGAASEQDSLAQTLASGSTLTTLLLFFGLGLLLTFTPCVFPMIPILSSIIVGQGKITTPRAFSLSLAYVLAMALTYTVVGVIAGLSGANLQVVFQNPWVLGAFSLLFVLLSFSMFGFYQLQLPASWQGKLATLSNSQRGGSIIGVAVMGFLSALIVGPCVTAPLVGALIYISQTGDALLGGAALFSMSMGMGMPLLLVGVSAGRLLPKAGAWMDAVKAVFGVMLLAVAVWMLERIIPAEAAMLLWTLLVIGSAIYMGALEPATSGWSKLWKGLGLVLLIHGGLMVVGLATGSTDPLQPLRGFALAAEDGSGMQAAQLNFRSIKSGGDLDREIAAAQAAGKSVMVDFYADWCISCKEFEKYTFSDPNVVAALANTVTLKADVTANDETDQALMKRFGIIGPPSILFFGSSGGDERRSGRVVGFMPAEQFQAHIERTLATP